MRGHIAGFHGIGRSWCPALDVGRRQNAFALETISTDRRWSGMFEDRVAEQVIPFEPGSEDRGGVAAL